LYAGSTKGFLSPGLLRLNDFDFFSVPHFFPEVKDLGLHASNPRIVVLESGLSTSETIQQHLTFKIHTIRRCGLVGREIESGQGKGW
jgi:hypothetical protein